MRPDRPKQNSTVPWKESAPLNLELMTISWMVQSTKAVSPTRRAIPVKSPACRSAYGWPMMPAPLPDISPTRLDRTAYMMLFAMFINAFRRLLLGFALSKWSSGSNSSASVTLGASMSVSSGTRRPSPAAGSRSSSPPS